MSTSMPSDPGSSRAEIFAWLPFVAAARLAEGVPQEVEALLHTVETALAAGGSVTGQSPDR
jgi:hypothetical protein